MDAIVKYPNRWPAGVSGNPNGRPPGHHTRHLFSEAMLRDLSASWSRDGATVLQRVAKENPSSARLLPADVAISIQAQAPALDAHDLSILRYPRLDSRRQLDAAASGAGIRARRNPFSWRKANNP